MTFDELQRYYAEMPDAGRYSGRCDLPLPETLAGRRVVDLGCRRGKGVCKIADRVGVSGWVLGVDPVEDRVRAARAYAAAHGVAVALDSPDMPYVEFVCAPFEDLHAAGLEDASVDVVVVNNVLNTVWDRNLALHEIARVLAPGGMLYHAGIFAHVALDEAQARAFAAEGNVFGAASTLEQFEEALHNAGFKRVVANESRPVVPDGADAAPALADRSFFTTIVQAFK